MYKKFNQKIEPAEVFLQKRANNTFGWLLLPPGWFHIK